jgi:hypothetical protein
MKKEKTKINPSQDYFFYTKERHTVHRANPRIPVSIHLVKKITRAQVYSVNTTSSSDMKSGSGMFFGTTHDAKNFNKIF